MNKLISVLYNQGNTTTTDEGPTGIADFFTKLELPSQAQTLIRYLFWGVVGAAAVYFAIGVVTNLIGYFKADNEREKTESKDKAIQKAVGMIICLVAGTILSLLLQAIGLGSIFSVTS